MAANHAEFVGELESDEGREKWIYLDAGGNWTVGVGWNLTANGLPDDIIDMLRDRAIEQAKLDAIAFAGQLVWDALCWPRRYVLVNMAFNLGREKLFGFRLARAALKVGDFEETAAQILDSKAAKKQAPARYERLAGVMRRGY